jgi:hypothetical protein
MKYKKYHSKRLLGELQNCFKGSDSSSGQYNYVNIIKEAISNEEIFNNFRSDQRYGDILEHISDDLAREYYFKLREELSHKDIVSYCESVKNIGSPSLKYFEKDELNPTTLRYINVALDLKKKFPNGSFENIIELGAGFGGQALILDKIYKIKNYTFIDLPQVNKLIEKFINLHKYRFEAHFSEIEIFDSSLKYDLFLSNYAFSELPRNLQIEAANKIISKSNYGYMIVNNFNNLSFRYLSKKGYSKTIKNMSIHEEIPESYIFNKLLTFRS